MMFNLDEVAAYLHISVQDVERLVREQAIPFEYQGKRSIFRRKEIDGWAHQRIMGMNHDKLADFHRVTTARAHDLSLGHAIMPELIKLEGINPDMSAKTKPSLIRSIVKLAETTELVIYPDDLQESIVEREKLCSTALSGGFALMHTLHHDPYLFEDSFIVLARTIQPIPFRAVDGQMTNLFFLLCCQDNRIHQHVLARMCMMCQRTSMILDLHAAETSDEILQIMIDKEQELIGSKICN